MPARLVSPPRTGSHHRLLVDLTPDPTVQAQAETEAGIFDYATEAWRWEGGELATRVGPGRGTGSAGRLPDIDLREMGPLVERWLALGVSRELLDRVISLAARADVAAAIADLDDAGLSSLIETGQRRRGLAALSAVVTDSTSTRAELIHILRAQSWVFGGRYLTPYARDPLPVLDAFSLPLIRTDGAIHLIEPDLAFAADLVIHHGGGYEVGPLVVAAVNRAINQLVLLDEHAGEIRGTLGVECRRASATVVIGDPRHSLEVDETTALNTLRTYGSHLSGIEILTYAELVEGAERALAIVEPQELLVDPDAGYLESLRD